MADDTIDAAPELEVESVDVAPEADPLDAAPEAAPIEKTPTKVEVVAPKVKSMDDTLRDKYRELGSPKKDTDVNRPRARNADGTFTTEPPVLPVAKTPAKPEVVAPELQTAPEAVAPKLPAAAVAPGLEKAPSSWKKEAQAKYAALDPEIKAEVHRREQDMHKGIAAYKAKSDTFDLLDAEIRPYEAMLRAANQTPQMTIRSLMNTAYRLQQGTQQDKVAVLADIAREYGVVLDDVPAIIESLKQGQPQVDPRIAEIERRQAAYEQRIENDKQEAARREYAGYVSEAQTFAGKNQHYEAVKLDMAALIESGRAESMQDAYDKAIWANPETRAILVAEQQAAERKSAADKAAAAKKAASTNVPARGTLPSTPKVGGTMDDTIREAYRKLHGV